MLKALIDAGYTFRCITVEHDAYKQGEEPRKSLRELLTANGYKLFRGDVSYTDGPNHEFEGIGGTDERLNILTAFNRANQMDKL